MLLANSETKTFKSNKKNKETRKQTLALCPANTTQSKKQGTLLLNSDFVVLSYYFTLNLHTVSKMKCS